MMTRIASRAGGVRAEVVGYSRGNRLPYAPDGVQRSVVSGEASSSRLLDLPACERMEDTTYVEEKQRDGEGVWSSGSVLSNCDLWTGTNITGQCTGDPGRAANQAPLR